MPEIPAIPPSDLPMKSKYFSADIAPFAIIAAGYVFVEIFDLCRICEAHLSGYFKISLTAAHAYSTLAVAVLSLAGVVYGVMRRPRSIAIIAHVFLMTAVTDALLPRPGWHTCVVLGLALLEYLWLRRPPEDLLWTAMRTSLLMPPAIIISLFLISMSLDVFDADLEKKRALIVITVIPLAAMVFSILSRAPYQRWSLFLAYFLVFFSLRTNIGVGTLLFTEKMAVPAGAELTVILGAIVACLSRRGAKPLRDEGAPAPWVMRFTVGLFSATLVTAFPVVQLLTMLPFASLDHISPTQWAAPFDGALATAAWILGDSEAVRIMERRPPASMPASYAVTLGVISLIYSPWIILKMLDAPSIFELLTILFALASIAITFGWGSTVRQIVAAYAQKMAFDKNTWAPAAGGLFAVAALHLVLGFMWWLPVLGIAAALWSAWLAHQALKHGNPLTHLKIVRVAGCAGGIIACLIASTIDAPSHWPFVKWLLDHAP